MKVTEIAFTGYPVSDMERARAFYEGVLGLVPEMAEQFPASCSGEMMWWVEYDINGGTLALSDSWTPSGGSGPSIALEVDDLDAWCEKLKQNNTPFTFETIESPVCRFFGVKDPDGNDLVLHQRKADCKCC